MTFPRMADDVRQELADFFLSLRDVFSRGDCTLDELLAAIRAQRIRLIATRDHIEDEGARDILDAILAALPFAQGICSRPRMQLRTRYQVLDIELVRRITPYSLQHLGAHSEHWKGRTLSGLIPSRMDALTSEDAEDIYENLFFGMAMQRAFHIVLDHVRRLEKQLHQTTALIAWDRYLGVFHDYRRMQMFERLVPGYECAAEEDRQKRIEGKQHFLKRIERGLSTVLASRFYRALDRRAIEQFPLPVRPTNILKMDNRYRQILMLWQSILRYEEARTRGRGKQDVGLAASYSAFVTLLLVYALDLAGDKLASSAPVRLDAAGHLELAASAAWDGLRLDLRTERLAVPPAAMTEALAVLVPELAPEDNDATERENKGSATPPVKRENKSSAALSSKRENASHAEESRTLPYVRLTFTEQLTYRIKYTFDYPIEKLRARYPELIETTGGDHELIFRRRPTREDLKDFMIEETKALEKERKRRGGLSNSEKGLYAAYQRTWPAYLDTVMRRLPDPRTYTVALVPLPVRLAGDDDDLMAQTDAILAFGEALRAAAPDIDSLLLALPADTVGADLARLRAPRLAHRLLSYGEAYVADDAAHGSYRLGLLPVAQDDILSAPRLEKIIALHRTRLRMGWGMAERACPVCASPRIERVDAQTAHCLACGSVFSRPTCGTCGKNFDWLPPDETSASEEALLDVAYPEAKRTPLDQRLDLEKILGENAITDFAIDDTSGDLRLRPRCPHCGHVIGT